MKTFLVVMFLALALAQESSPTTDPNSGYFHGLARGLQASATTDGVCLLGFTPLGNSWNSLLSQMNTA